MNELKNMWAEIPPATPDDLAGARRRLTEGMRRPRRRVVTAPRVLVAAGVAVAAALTPLAVDRGSPAYAVTTGSDGTITVTINEMRDPEGLEADLAAAGVTADVTFLAPGTRCQGGRFTSVDDMYDGPPADSPEELRAMVEAARSPKAVRAGMKAISISPDRIGRGETLVLEFRDEGGGSIPWTLGAYLAVAGSAVAPCAPIPG